MGRGPGVRRGFVLVVDAGRSHPDMGRRQPYGDRLSSTASRWRTAICPSHLRAWFVYPPFLHVVGAVSILLVGMHLMSLVMTENLVFVPLLAFGCYGTGKLVERAPSGVARRAVRTRHSDFRVDDARVLHRHCSGGHGRGRPVGDAGVATLRARDGFPAGRGSLRAGPAYERDLGRVPCGSRSHDAHPGGLASTGEEFSPSVQPSRS